MSEPPACEVCQFSTTPWTCHALEKGGPPFTLYPAFRAGREAHTSTPSEGPAGGSSGLWPNFPASRGRNIWRTRKKFVHDHCPVSPPATGHLDTGRMVSFSTGSGIRGRHAGPARQVTQRSGPGARPGLANYNTECPVCSEFQRNSKSCLSVRPSMHGLSSHGKMTRRLCDIER